MQKWTQQSIFGLQYNWFTFLPRPNFFATQPLHVNNQSADQIYIAGYIYYNSRQCTVSKQAVYITLSLHSRQAVYITLSLHSRQAVYITLSLHSRQAVYITLSLPAGKQCILCCLYTAGKQCILHCLYTAGSVYYTV